MCAAEEDSQSLREACERGDELGTGRASMTVGSELAKAERDSLAPRIREWEVAPATPDRKLGVVVH